MTFEEKLNEIAKQSRAEGRSEGRQEGIREGMLKGREALLEAAERMLKTGDFTVEQVADFQNLTVAEVCQLKEKLEAHS